MSLWNGPNIFEEQDSTALANFIAFGGDSDVATGPQFGTCTIDPSTGAGITANAGSVLLRPVGDSTEVYIKTGPAATDWTQLASSASASVAVIADPGDAAAIPVDQSYTFGLAIGAGAETNTLADPSFAGQTLTITVDAIGGGTRAVTVAQAYDQAANTVITFNTSRDSVGLVAVQAGALRWQLQYNDGATLS